MLPLLIANENNKIIEEKLLKMDQPIKDLKLFSFIVFGFN